MRGIPKHVVQKEVKIHKEHMTVRDIVKSAVVEVKPECSNIVASSVYDSEPVHYLVLVSMR